MQNYEQVRLNKEYIDTIKFLTEFQKKLGEQKIDLVVEYEGSQNKIIFTDAKENGVLI